MRIVVGHKGRWSQFHVDEDGVPLIWTLLSGKLITRVDLPDLIRRCSEAGIEPPSPQHGIRLACCGFWYTIRDENGKELPGSRYQAFDPDEWKQYINPPPPPTYDD